MRPSITRLLWSYLLIAPALALAADTATDTSDGASKRGDPNKVMIELIADGSTVSVERGGSPLELGRGDPLQVGDVITTEKQTVYVQLYNFNEIQLAPHTSIKIEELTNTEDGRNVIDLRNGIAWGLIANGTSIGTPFYIRTAQAAVAISAGNIIIEAASEHKKTGILLIEGNLKYAKNIEELSQLKKSLFLNTEFRVHFDENGPGKPKKFKRNVLISYLNQKAKSTAKDMATRGSRVLSQVARKGRSLIGDDDITWNVIGGPNVPTGTDGTSGAGALNTGAKGSVNMSGPSVNSMNTPAINL